MDTVRDLDRRRIQPGIPASAAAVLALALTFTVYAFGTSLGKFNGTTIDSGNQVSGAPDWVAPTTSVAVAQKTQGGATGAIRPGGTYRVYANVADTGNPASGVATAAANVSSLTTGQTAAALSAGSYVVSGQTYGYASGTLIANGSLTAGSYSFAVTSTDVAGNSRTQSGYAVTVDATAPTGADVQTTNHAGGTVGQAELGDTIVFTFTEPIDPASIVAGWSGSTATHAVVRISHGSGKNDTLTVYDATNTNQLALGSVDLGRTDYTNSNITFGATGTPSTVGLNGNTVVVTLGTPSAAAHKAGGTGTVKWTTSPPAGATDLAGNALIASVVTESGSPIKAF